APPVSKMPRRPRAAPLVPYTTLFRSRALVIGRRRTARGRHLPLRCALLHLGNQAEHLHRVLAQQQADHDDGGDAAQAELHAAARQRLAAAVLDVAAATGAAPFHGGSPRPGAGAMVTAVAAAGSMAPAQGLEQGLAGAAVGFPAQ